MTPISRNDLLLRLQQNITMDLIIVTFCTVCVYIYVFSELLEVESVIQNHISNQRIALFTHSLHASQTTKYNTSSFEAAILCKRNKIPSDGLLPIEASNLIETLELLDICTSLHSMRW